MFKCRDELVTHHSIAHNISPGQVEQQQQQSHQTNRGNNNTSVAQPNDSSPVVDNEEGEGRGEESGVIADNAAQRIGSLVGKVERDRRKVISSDLVHHACVCMCL